eukprot:1918258-Amphidinium_carterae.3
MSWRELSPERKRLKPSSGAASASAALGAILHEEVVPEPLFERSESDGSESVWEAPSKEEALSALQELLISSQQQKKIVTAGFVTTLAYWM